MLKLGDLVRVDKKGWRGHTEKGKVVSDYLGQPGFQVELEDGELLFFNEKDLIKIKNKDEDYSVCEYCNRESKRNKISEQIINKLNISSSKNVCLYAFADKYIIEECGKEVKYPFNLWSTRVYNFDYSGKEIPTIKEIQKILDDTYLNVTNPFK